MRLRDTRLLLVILGVSKRNDACSSRAGPAPPSLYIRATSSEGLQCIGKYWDSHCSTFSKVPALALLAPGSCPKGLAPPLFLELLSRLTDLQQWQIWDLFGTLDVHSCGFVGCAEFTLLVVLLCAGASQQQLQAVHAYGSSITWVFLGARAGVSIDAGLCQCCQIMGLPASGVHTALQGLQLLQEQQRGSTGSSTQPTHSGGGSSSSSPCGHSTAQQGGGYAAAGLGCCCCCQDGRQQQQQQQWACGAAAHRQHLAAERLPAGPGHLLPQAEVELVLCTVAEQHIRWRGDKGKQEFAPEQFGRFGCRIC